jgi:predicted nucleic acid-binding protein
LAVVDASVLLATILTHEPHHAASKAWLDAVVSAGAYFSAPTILLGEVAAPLGRAYNQPELAKKVVQELVAAPFVKFVPISLPLANRAAVIAAEYQLRGCDAVYVSLAETLDEELITLDKQQIERAKNIIPTRHP